MKLESICAEVFSVSAMTIKCQYTTCFIQRTGIYQVWSCLWKWIMSQTKEMRNSEKELMLLIRLEKFTQIHSQTDCVQMEEIQDHCYLPKKWSTNKDHSKAERVIVCEVAKVPRVTSKQLKAFLTLANVNVHEPTIRRTLSNHGVHGRVARRKPLFSKKKITC